MQQPQHDLRPFQQSVASPRRYVSAVLVIGLHVVAVLALAAGLANRMSEKPLEDIMAEVVKEKPPEQEKAPPPPPPDLQRPPPPFVPPPEINIQLDTGPTNAITTVQSTQPVKPQPAPPAITAPASVGRPHQCGRDKYPAMAVRLNHEGVVLLNFTITVEGSVKDVRVEKSSGFPELDEAAMSCASNWHYKAAQQNGQPIETPWKTSIKWNLGN